MFYIVNSSCLIFENYATLANQRSICHGDLVVRISDDEFICNKAANWPMFKVIDSQGKIGYIAKRFLTKNTFKFKPKTDIMELP